MCRVYLYRNYFPKNMFMYWPQGCANTGTTSIQRAGPKCEYIFQKEFLENSFAQKLIPWDFFPACIGFVPGGTARRRHPQTPWRLFDVYVFSFFFPLKTSLLVYIKLLFGLLRHLSLQSWKHLWCIRFSLRSWVTKDSTADPLRHSFKSQRIPQQTHSDAH